MQLDAGGGGAHVGKSVVVPRTSAAHNQQPPATVYAQIFQLSVFFGLRGPCGISLKDTS